MAAEKPKTKHTKIRSRAHWHTHTKPPGAKPGKPRAQSRPAVLPGTPSLAPSSHAAAESDRALRTVPPVTRARTSRRPSFHTFSWHKSFPSSRSLAHSSDSTTVVDS
eukprot:754629-Hanusia_phi.AAC.1